MYVQDLLFAQTVHEATSNWLPGLDMQKRFYSKVSGLQGQLLGTVNDPSLTHTLAVVRGSTDALP